VRFFFVIQRRSWSIFCDQGTSLEEGVAPKPKVEFLHPGVQWCWIWTALRRGIKILVTWSMTSRDPKRSKSWSQARGSAALC